MPFFPDEDLPIQVMTLHELNERAWELLVEEQHDPLKHKFVNLMLAGRNFAPPGQAGGLVEHRIRLNVKEPYDNDAMGFVITRDYDSIIGITTNLPFKIPLSIYVVPPFKHNLSGTIHIKRTIITPHNNNVPKATSIHLIPHICISKTQVRQQTLLFFPKLCVTKKGQRKAEPVTQEQLATLYDKCMRPAFEEALMEHIAHLPVSYAAALRQCRTSQGTLTFSTYDIPPERLPVFGAVLREKLEEIPCFQDSFFLHQWRGTKGESVHHPGDDEKAASELDAVFRAIDVAMVLEEGPWDPDSWYIDIGLEFMCPGHIVQWLEGQHHTIIKYALPHLSNGEIGRILNHKNFHTDTAALLYDLAGFRMELKPRRALNECIVYMNVYTTDKSPTYQLHRGAFRYHQPKELVPTQIAGVLKDMEVLGEVWDACAGNGGPGQHGPIQEGSARFEVRIKMELNAATSMLRYIPDDFINETFQVIDPVTWWSFKIYRLTALRLVLKAMQAAPVGVRVLPSMLRMGAIAIWILNALTSRPGEQRWDLKLIPTTAAYYAVDPNSDVRHADVAAELVAEDEAWPLLEQRGCYFIAGVVKDHDVLRCPNVRDLDIGDWEEIYYLGSLEELRRIFSAGHLTVQRKIIAAIAPRRRRNDIIEDNRHSPERDLPLNLEEAGVRMGVGLLLSGPDMEGASLAEREGNAVGEQDVTLEGKVNGIWQRFLRDIMRSVPFRAGKHPFSTLSDEEVEAATEATYKTTALPFTAAWVKVASTKEWKEVFDRSFPSKAAVAAAIKVNRELIAKGQKPVVKQQYGKARYYETWMDLVQKTNFGGDEKIRQKLYDAFKTLTWMPAGKSDRMWMSGGRQSGRWTRVPAGEGSAVTILINAASGIALSAVTLAN